MNLNENRVREYAYQIWESEGRPHGQHHRHWEMACKLAANQSPEASNGTSGIRQTNEPLEKVSSSKQMVAGEAKKKEPKKPAAAKTTTPKTSRQKKAKIVNDTLETELTPINNGFKGSV